MITILQGLAALLAFLLPFEVRRPVLSLPFMAFTDLELTTLAVLAAGIVRAVLLGRKFAPPGRLTIIVCALAAFSILSAAMAPAFRVASLKFALRTLTGVGVFFAVYTGCTGCAGYAGYPPLPNDDRNRFLSCISCISLFIRPLVAGAAISSALGIWTCLSPDGTAWLIPLFREREFLIGNTVRLSGTFEYPNIAAAFLALAFVLSFAHTPTKSIYHRAHGEHGEKIGKATEPDQTPMRFGNKDNHPLISLCSLCSLWWKSFVAKVVLWAAAQGVILLGLIMTLSRAGLVVALFGFVLVVATHAMNFYRMNRLVLSRVAGRDRLGAIGWAVEGMSGMDRINRMPSILSILYVPVKLFLPTFGVSALCLAGAFLFYPPFALRFQTGGDAAWYRARYETLEPIRLAAGGISTVRVRVTNAGRMPWTPNGQHPFRLSYHWLEADAGRAIPAPQARTELPGEIRPGASITFTAKVAAPPRPGDYVLAWDMVHEYAAWFSQKGCPTGQVACRVTAAGERPVTARGVESPPDPGALEAESVSRRTLWRAGWEMFKVYPILGVGPDNFRRLWGREFGMTRWDERVHANNLFVETFATTGLLGGMTLLALLATAVRMQARCLRNGWEDGGRFSAMAALFAATAVFVAHGMVDYFMAFTPMYLLFWMVMGMSAGMARECEA